MRIIVDVEDGYKPEDGDAFDAVVDALEFAEIPAVVSTDTPRAVPKECAKCRGTIDVPTLPPDKSELCEDCEDVG